MSVLSPRSVAERRSFIFPKLFPGIASGIRWRVVLFPLPLDGPPTVDIVSPAWKTPLTPEAIPGIRLHKGTP
jgi:hypothetical protein